MRNNIKGALLSMLDSPDLIVIKSAATCVAAVAVIEIPNKQWPDLITNLTENAQSDMLNTRLASLYTLGFICEDIDPIFIDER